MSRFIVYGLVDPNSQELRYVGKSSTGLRTPNRHFTPSIWKTSSNKHLYNWVQKCIRGGSKPIIKILAKCKDNESCLDKEVELIAHHRKVGQLLNIAPGGTGGPLSKSTKQKMSRAKQGTKPSAQNVLAKAAANKRSSRPVIDDLGQVYESVAAAARALGVRKPDFLTHMRGTVHTIHQQRFAYYRKECSYAENLILRDQDYVKREELKAAGQVRMKSHWRAVQDQHGTRYESIAAAARAVGVTASAVRDHIKNQSSGMKGFRFEVIDE